VKDILRVLRIYGPEKGEITVLEKITLGGAS
jgi:hypothetical protein